MRLEAAQDLEVAEHVEAEVGEVIRYAASSLPTPVLQVPGAVDVVFTAPRLSRTQCDKASKRLFTVRKPTACLQRLCHA